MQKTFIIFLSLVSLLSANIFRDSAPLTQLLASKDGVVKLKKTANSGYVASVDFQKDSVTNIPMTIALYTFDQLLATKCFDFKEFKPSEFKTSKLDEKEDTINYPYFTAVANELSTTYTLDKDNWILQEDGAALLAKSCSTEGDKNFGAESWGMLGLGFIGDAKKNFVGDSGLFALDWRVDPPKIDFKKEAIEDLNPVSSLKADGNWHSSLSSPIQFGEYKKEFKNDGDYTVIFDLNIDTIGIPLEIYENMIKHLNDNFMTCETDKFDKPKCKVTADTWPELPNLFLHQGSNLLSYITIEPKHYIVDYDALKKAKDEEFSLNIRSLSSTQDGINYVTPDYDNYFILGSPILKGQVTSFNMKTSRINGFIDPNAQGGAGAHSSIWRWVLGFLLVLVVVGIVVYCFFLGGTRKMSAALGLGRGDGVYAEHDNNSNDPFIKSRPQATA